MALEDVTVFQGKRIERPVKLVDRHDERGGKTACVPAAGVRGAPIQVGPRQSLHERQAGDRTGRPAVERVRSVDRHRQQALAEHLLETLDQSPGRIA